MGKIVRFALAGLALSFFVALAPAAQADTVRVRSQPNGDLGITSSSGSLTDKDKDGDFNTLTKADTLSLFYAVANLTEEAQTVHITVVLDGPGTVRDTTLVDEDVLIGARGSLDDIDQNSFEFQIKRNDWPEGSYSLSVTGSGTESATATSHFTVAY
jgi:hypothetical protein